MYIRVPCYGQEAIREIRYGQEAIREIPDETIIGWTLDEDRTLTIRRQTTISGTVIRWTEIIRDVIALRAENGRLERFDGWDEDTAHPANAPYRR